MNISGVNRWILQRIRVERPESKESLATRSQGPTGPPGVTRQVSDRRVEPPLVIQNAMLTKDKKPFTYTPGGIDLSEIKSPRMARRIERNANAPGVGDIPRVSPPRGPTEPLPPSAIAAMQPALPVQVLPAGAVPPPPPPPMNIPPPPPMDPLPTKVVTTNEGIFERPDMTKIIPENPMALLRKTGGVNRRSFIEEPAYSDFQPQVNNQQNYITPQIYMPETQARQPVQVQQSAPSQFRQVPPQAQVQPQQQYTQPKPQMATVPRQESYQEQPQEIKTSTAQLGQLYIPPLNNDNQRNIASPPVKVVTPSAKVSNPPSPQQRVPQSPAQSPGSPQSPMATLNRAPRPWQAQKPPTTEVPPWAHKSHTSPPSSPGEEEEEEEEEEAAIVQQSPQINYQKRAVPQSPGVQQNFMNQQSPQRVPPSPGFQQQQQQNFNHQQRMPQQQPNVQPNVIGRVIIPVQMDAPPSSPNVEAVYVTQPIVLQHPGPIPDGSQQSIKEQQLRQQQQLQQQKLQQQQLQQQKLQQQQQLQQQQRQHQYQQQQSQSTRIIPIQIEGGTNNNGQSSTPNSASVGSATPGSARTFNRQPSWSQTGPTQSNSFKVLQKITNTDGDEDENEESTEHEPRRSQQFEQPPLDQVRKLKLSEDDQELMNKLKQGVDQENYLHKEVDPRYRGATIPSKAFKFLQSMTDSPNQPTTPSVPRNPQVGNQGPTVRTIPVQIEGEATGKPYIPPSEQTVPEPKKYTGGKIPSRSFKVLQAMTGEACADGNQGSENCSQPNDPSFYYGYNANYPPPPPMPPTPYWPNYWPPYFYSPCPTPTNDVTRNDNAEKPPKISRNTPAPQKQPKKARDSSESDSEYERRSTANPRSTPLHFRGCSPQKPPKRPTKDSESDSDHDRRANMNVRSQTPSFRGCSPQAVPKRFSKENGTDFTHTNSRNTPLPFRGSSPQAPSRKLHKDSEFDHMEGARRSTSVPRSTPLPYWGCYSPFYPLPYGDCDREVEQIKNNSEDQQQNNPTSTTPMPFWGCYSPFYPIPYSNESDVESEQTKPGSFRNTPSRSQETDTEDQNYSPYPYWDPYAYPPYYYGYPPMYPYPIYPSMPSDNNEESMNYSSTDEMALYYQTYGQNANETDNVGEEEDAPDDSTPTPEKCQNFDVIRNSFEEKCRNVETKEMNGVQEKRRQPLEDVLQFTEEKCNNFEELRKNFEDNCYVEDNRNFLNQRLSDKVKQMEDKLIAMTRENLEKHNKRYSDTETETETETETCGETSDSDYEDTETEVEGEADENINKKSDNYGGLQAIRSVSDINVYSVDESNCTDEEDNVSEATTTTEENDDGDESIPHQLSTIYEESERSYSSRMERHTRESSVATSASIETVATGNECDSGGESDETCINGTVCVNENDDLTADITINNPTNENISIDTTFTIDRRMEADQSPSKLVSNDKEYIVSPPVVPEIEESPNIEGITTNGNEENNREDINYEGGRDEGKNSNDQENVETNCIVVEEENKTQEDDEPDWWSEINKDREDDVLNYKKNRYEYNLNYKDGDNVDHYANTNDKIEENNEENKSDRVANNNLNAGEGDNTFTKNHLPGHPENSQNLLGDTYSQLKEKTMEEIRVSDETCTKQTEKYAIVHNEDLTQFINESRSDTTYALITEGEEGTKTVVTTAKVNSGGGEIVLDDENIQFMKEELVSGVIKSNRLETTVSQDISEVSKDKTSIKNNYILENQEKINQAYVVETVNGDVISEKITEDNYTKSSKSASSINNMESDINECQVLNETKANRSSTKEILSNEVLCSGIVQSTNCLIENLQSLNELSKQFYLNNNQYKSEEVKETVSSNKIVEHKANDDTVMRQENEEIREKECTENVVLEEMGKGVKEIKHKKVTRRSKHFSFVSSSEYDSDIDSGVNMRDKYPEINTQLENEINSKPLRTSKKKKKDETRDENQYIINNNKSNQLRNNNDTEIKKACQEEITEDFEDCHGGSANSNIENSVCSQYNNETNQEEVEVKMPSIKERIEALQRASQTKNKPREETDVPINIKERISVMEDAQVQSETLNAQSTKSTRSLEDVSEDDIDSGVTSDISRHISDNESDFPELRKMTRYQRASTHSRLFKLLQEECENEDSEEEEGGNVEKIDERAVIASDTNVELESKESMQSRRENLTLPLKTCSESDSFSSSGINSPGSPVVNDRLVNELVHSLLKRKKGHIFRNMSMEKLHAAAFRILQEELEGSAISPREYSSFLSPLRNSTGDSTPAQTPQEFYGNYSEYNQYYDTWNDPHLPYENNYDMLPTRALKLMYDNPITNQSGGISGYLGRCPRVLGGKNVHKDLLYLSETSANQCPEKSIETNGATSAS